MSISDEHYRKIKKRMKAALLRYNLTHMTEDFTQDYCVTILEGCAQHQTINQFVIDNLRRLTKSRTKQGEQKKLEFLGKFKQLKE